MHLCLLLCDDNNDDHSGDCHENYVTFQGEKEEEEILLEREIERERNKHESR